MTTRKKTAEKLALEYNWNTKEEYFDYIIESRINGQTQQVRSLFNAMTADDRREFLGDYCNRDSDVFYICLNEML